MANSKIGRTDMRILIRLNKFSECDNCGDVTTQDNLLPLEEAKDLSMRLDVGSDIPAGECLECGAFSYIKEDNS